MAEKKAVAVAEAEAAEEVLPFSEDDLVGPEDRPQPAWEIVMYEWHAIANRTIKEYLDEAAGAVVRAVHCAPKTAEGIIYVRTCDPKADKAHHVTVSTDHRSATFSLYTPLLSFDFPRLSPNHKAIFTCRPHKVGKAKLLVIEVSGYRVERINRRDSGAQGEVEAAKAREAAAASEQEPED